MLNPVFSTAHMRDMVPIFNGIARKLMEAIKPKLIGGPQEIDILQWMNRASLEMIGQSALGYSFDPLLDNSEPHPYSVAMRDYVPILSSLVFYREYILATLMKIGSPRFQRFVVDIIPWKKIHQLRDMVDAMHQTSLDIFEAKKKALEKGEGAFEARGGGKDIMSILMKANSEATSAERLPEEEIIAQISTFTFAGTDTTSNGLSRILHLLSTHPRVQDRLRLEVTEAISAFGENISHDELVSLPFLDAVCRETLRLYAPVPIVSRIVRQDASVPLSNPVKGIDGREMHSILIPKDTKIYISILHANRDPAFWGPDSDEWKPERWLSPLPQTLTDARVPGIYSNLMTFFGGGRACIGFKLSQLEMKVVLFTLISRFRFSPSKEIEWRMGGIVTPSVKGSRVPQLPLKMEIVKAL